MGESVKVVVRCRPLNKREASLKSKTVVYMDPKLIQCSIVNPNDSTSFPKSFTFDGVYHTDSTTESIYVDSTYKLIEGVLEGYNSTVFAYGQTGCGKSFTMQGISLTSNSTASLIPNANQQKGIIPRAFEQIFESIETSEQVKYLVHASYLEIYNEEIRDLLANNENGGGGGNGKCIKKLELKENPEKGVYVNDLSKHSVHCVEECEQLMERGWKNRSVGATLMNADSSRSHSIFSISVEMIDTQQVIRRGKLNLVDLAGSERQTKTGSTGDRLKEATKINLSLSALGNVISALVDGKSTHIPYRDSKLTRLLQDSLGGNTKTLMIACISPADNNYDETLSTLRYANRAKNIKNKPKINQDPKDALLAEYQDEIKALKELLEKTQNGINLELDDSPENENELIINDIEMEKDKIRLEYENQLEQMRINYEAEQKSNAKLQADVALLKEKYKQELDELQQEKDNILEISQSDSGNLTISPEQQEALARLQEIEENMVGGEKAHDYELIEKVKKKKSVAENRSKILAEALKNSDDDAIIIKAYDNIQEELRAKNEGLKKAKIKIRSLDREVQDLYSEFQNDRTDYLDLIRKQDQQIKLFQSILEKMQPIIRKDCNFSNLDVIKSEAIWSDETQKWRLPDLVIKKTTLPPAAGSKMSFNSKDGGRTSSSDDSNENEYDEYNEPIKEGESILIKKFDSNDHEKFAENYFKPKRANEIIKKAQKDANRVLNLANNKLNNNNGLNGLNGNLFVNWNNHFNTNSAGPQTNLNKTRINSNTTWSPTLISQLAGHTGTPIFLNSPARVNDFFNSTEMRKPGKLESLPIAATTKAMKKLKQLKQNHNPISNPISF